MQRIIKKMVLIGLLLIISPVVLGVIILGLPAIIAELLYLWASDDPDIFVALMIAFATEAVALLAYVHFFAQG